MKTVDITYRYETRDTPARPRPLDSNAALSRLNDGNRGFAALLEDPSNKHVQRIISVDSRDLGLGDETCLNNVRSRLFLAAPMPVCQLN